MSTDQKVEVLSLEVPGLVAGQFRSICIALNHDELEETFAKLVELGVKAISLSNKERPVIHLCSQDPLKRFKGNVSCPVCHTGFVPALPEDQHGLKEMAVNLA